MYYTYILHCSNGELYTGFTDNLKKRYKKHQNGYVNATKNRRPLKLIYYECFFNQSDAKRREKYLKGGNGKKELKIMLKDYFKTHPWQKVQ